MKKKTIYLICSILHVLALLSVLGALVWGKTLRTAKANRRLEQADDPGGPAEARQIYEDLLIDQPHSPYLLHNLGLSLYRDGRAEAAAGRFRSAGEELARVRSKMTQGRRVNPENRRRLEHIFHYHQGSADFTVAENTAASEGAVEKYQKALAGFAEAIRADPDDPDAKYNYELTLLRLKEAEQKNSQKQDQNEEQREGRENEESAGQDQNRQDEENREDESRENQEESGDRENRKEKEEEAQSPSGESGAGSQEEGEDSGMSKEEAVNLLEMAESGALYQGPLLPAAPPAGKDW